MRIGGLASGIDTDSLIKEMMAAQKLPMDKLTQQKAWTEWQKDSFRDVNLAFSNLNTLAGEMRLQGTFNSYAATSSAPENVAAETTSNSVSGSYGVTVTTLASGAKAHSGSPITINAASTVRAKASDVIGVAGFVKVNGGTGIEIKADMTYEQVAKTIQEATIGKVPELRMSFDNTTSSFFISSKGMGSDENFSMEFTDAAGTLSETLANQIINSSSATSFNTANATSTDTFMEKAENGSVTFDGITVNNLTSNKTTINGLTLNLVKVGTSTITVNANPTNTFDKIKAFVEKYNETIEEIEKQLVEKRYPDFQPLSAEQKKEMTDNEIELWEEKARSGLLRNDPILKSAIQELRRSLMDEVKGIPDGNIQLLSQIGINTGSWSEGGKLFIKEDKLKEALTNKPDEVMALFTNRVGDVNVGIGGRVYESLKNIMNNLSEKAGSIGSAGKLVDNSQLSKHLKRMDEEISRWQDKLGKIEDRYWKQFTAMEKAISQMNSQSTWISQSLGMM